MRLLVLSSGSAIPSGGSLHSGYLIEAAGKRWLVDPGTTVLDRLERFGRDFRRIDGIILSHHHPDHTSGLASILFALRATAPVNPSIEIIGGPGTEDFISRHRNLWGEWIEARGYGLIVTELNPPWPRLVKRGGLSITALGIVHEEASIGIRIEDDEEKVFAFTGDTSDTDEAVRVAMGADLLLMESSFPDGEPVEGHLTPSTAGRIARKAGAKRVVLTHFYPMTPRGEAAARAGEAFGGDVTAASEGLEISV